MNLNIKQLFKSVFPYLITILLWRMSMNFWNPGGILALIPIFYFSFIKPVRNFSLFAVFFCFLIDYKCNLLLFWTSLYCAFYAINGFQNFVDLTRQVKNGLFIFMAYFGFGIVILSAISMTLSGFITGIWLILWMGALYVPISAILKKVTYDR